MNVTPRTSGKPLSAAPSSEPGVPSWILLIHAIPPRPDYLRVKVGRRLHKVGAIAVKNSVYVLPRSDSAREDLQWIAQEIVADGGEASLCESHFIGGLTDEAIEKQFRDARERDYRALAKQARRLLESLSRARTRSDGRSGKGTNAEAILGRLRRRLEEIVAIDYFPAPARAEVESMLKTADDKLHPPDAAESSQSPEIPSLRKVRGRTWVTRKGIHVDRIASAWLIRRFIDRDAKLKYVEAKGYVPARGELRFDMFDAEFTHEGSLCTFEVLLARWGGEDPALRHIADMVHDIDLRDAKYGREETSGFTALITGICLDHREDDRRLQAGTITLDALYRTFQQRNRK